MDKIIFARSPNHTVAWQAKETVWFSGQEKRMLPSNLIKKS